MVEIAGGSVRVHPGSAPKPNVTLTGTPSLVLGLLVGALDVETARARGLQIDGDLATLRRVQPLIPPTGNARAAGKAAASPAKNR